MPNLSVTSNIPSLYLLLFIGIFVLFLLESFYFYKKRANSAPQEYTETPQGSNLPTILKFGLGAFVILVIGSGVFMFVKNRKTSPLPESTTTKVMQEASIPTYPPIPTAAPNEIALNITPTSTSTSVKTFTNTPTPTVSKKVAELPRTGGGQEEDQTSSEPIIVPKMPIAGLIPPSVIYFFTGLTTLAIGLML